MNVMQVVHNINPLNAELNPICHLLALLGAHHILHVSRIRVKMYTGSCSSLLYTDTRCFKHSCYVTPKRSFIVTMKIGGCDVTGVSHKATVLHM